MYVNANDYIEDFFHVIHVVVCHKERYLFHLSSFSFTILRVIFFFFRIGYNENNAYLIAYNQQLVCRTLYGIQIKYIGRRRYQIIAKTTIQKLTYHNLSTTSQNTKAAMLPNLPLFETVKDKVHFFSLYHLIKLVFIKFLNPIKIFFENFRMLT